MIENLSKEERKYLVYRIIREDDLSITEIVNLKEVAMTDELKEQRGLVGSLAIQACTLFMPKKSQELVKPALASSLLKSRQFKGTPFEKDLLACAFPKD